jgi:uncharacterized protein
MENKFSYYTIVTDPLNSDEDRIIFSTRTSQALIVKKDIYNLLAEGRIEEMTSEDSEKLIKAKIIVPESEHELEEIVNDNKDNIESTDVLYEVIQISANCQLGCDYCGQQHEKVNLAKGLYANLLQRIRAKASKKKYRGLFIGWFGGEPLVGLRQIRELTPLLKELADEFDLSFGAKIVTNGMSLKEKIFLELVNELYIRHIEVTLDGTAPYHDTRRITKEGGATFDIIFNNLLNILNRDDFALYKCKVTIRCNVDERNSESVFPLIDLLAKHNLQNKIDYFYPIGVYSWSQNEAHKKSLTKEEFAEMEIDWLIELVARGFNVSLLPGRVRSVCMAVSPVSDVYDPYGNIFNCTEVSLTPVYQNTTYIAGNLKYPAETHSTQRAHANWNDEILEGRFPCHSCKMLPVCGGACPKSWHEDMRACPPNKFNIKKKLELSYVVAKRNLTELLEEPQECRS